MPTIDRNDKAKEQSTAQHSKATVSEGERPIRFAGSELGAKPHICGFFNSTDEEYRLLLPFIKEGLERGEKAFHVVSPSMSDEHLRRLASFDIDVAGLAQGNQLELCDWDQVYFPDGRFDQDRMLAIWQSVFEGATQQGFPRTRLVAHMEWALEDREGVNDLLEYEARFNLIQQSDRDPVICAYDIAKFRGDVIVDIIRTHPMIIIGGILQENPFFVPPDEFVRELRERKATQAAHN